MMAGLLMIIYKTDENEEKVSIPMMAMQEK